MNRQFRPFALALMAALAMPVLAEIPGIPADLPLRYAVSYNTSPAGEIEVSIDRHDQGYRLTSTTSPNMLASLFIEAFTSEIEYRWQDGKLQLLSGRDRLQGKENYTRTFEVDHQAKVIALGNDRRYPMAADDRLASIAFPLELALFGTDHIEGVRFRQVSTRRVREFVYGTPERVSVEVPAGRYESTMITATRVDKPSTTVTVWLADGEWHLPVKISSTNKGATTVLELAGD